MLVYQNYHRHSHLTNVRIADSAVTNAAYARRAVELGHGILSSCEHGWQGQYNDVIRLAKENGLKPLVSAEAYWVRDREEKDRSNCHIFIAAMNEKGRRALNDVLSEANLTGFYGQPRLDIPLLLSLPKDDVVVTTACIGYWRYDDIEEITAKLHDHFGNNFFLEVQYHNTPAQIELNQRILQLREKLGAQLIMGCDSHYIYPDQAQARIDFLASKGLTYPEEDGWFMDYPDGDTAYQRFANQCVLSHDEILEAINNTNVFLNVEEYDSPVFNDDIKLPSLYPGWTQEQKNEEYMRLVWQGWDAYKKTVPEERWPEYEEEIRKEMQVVIDTYMADYFIIDYEVMKRGKELGGKLTKSGRGSGASFFTNTLLGFSDVDRISASVHMYPERFMSTARILQSKGIPDIDMNEAPTAPFVQAQAEILGQDHSYPMIAYGTMKKSAAWKLYAKSQGVPFEIANAVSEQIKRYELAVKHADEDEKDEIDINKFISREYKDIYEKSAEYLGLITSWSIAPCSSLIYQGSIRTEVGLVKIKDNVCCLCDGHWGEDGHFLKNDHLKVSVVDLIYKAYERIGREPPSVKELLAMCPPEDPAWDVYANGCTMGINQCEKEGTRARAMKYKPRNISELSAFVAAIRPGGASFYKQFESREPFAYGVKAFDELIQTKEFPYSFLLYQEQVMRALNYAGIDMADCYTAIKNIAKKRAEKVLAYKDTFIKGFRESIVRDENKSEDEAQKLAESLWGVIEDSAGYSFNSSHSYCVALDSLYGAWLKAHHPLAFYETYIRLMEEKGDKDKINAAKEEAESHFGIRFAPLRFGQDNRTIHADEEKNEMINTMGSIKGYGVTIGRTFYDCSRKGFTSFIDVLAYLDKNKVKEAKFKPLILIDYFEQFGNQRELLRIAELWDMFKQGEIKSIKRSAIDGNPTLRDIIQRYTTSTRKDGKDAASYTFHSEEDVMKCLYDCEKAVFAVGMQDLDMRVKIQNCVDILGYCDIRTGKEEDRRRLLVTEVFPLKTNGALWAYRLATKSLGSGKTARVTVKADLYNRRPINEGDIIYAAELYKNKAGYWYISDYSKEV
ncbi:MAG: PHP domain-containing protein [Alistipes sp.]|nr:PHP domain-containing protein [Alistipes sp.]